MLRKKGGISCETTLDELSCPSGISLALVDVSTWASDMTSILLFAAEDWRWVDGSIDDISEEFCNPHAENTVGWKIQEKKLYIKTMKPKRNAW